ncbi:MAG: pyridoxal 5'-phosphate synthase [Thermoleophilia bacterium]
MSEPLALLDRWLLEAREAGAPAPAAMSLATAHPSGRPSVRVVSLKRLDGDGLVFTTALWTRKAEELRVNPRIAAVLHWPTMGRQARVEGQAEIAERKLAEELFAERPRSRQLQAHVSRQGKEIESLDLLRDRLEALEAELGEGSVPCPEDWGAVRIVPDRIEFWEEAEDRMHRRTLFASSAGEWRRSLLAP